MKKIIKYSAYIILFLCLFGISVFIGDYALSSANHIKPGDLINAYFLIPSVISVLGTAIIWIFFNEK